MVPGRPAIGVLLLSSYYRPLRTRANAMITIHNDLMDLTVS